MTGEGPGERAPDVAEQGGFYEVGRDGAAIDGAKWFGSRGEFVHCFCGQFLSCAGTIQNQYRDLTLGDRAQGLVLASNCAQRKRVGWLDDFSGEFTATLSLWLRSQNRATAMG